jgi:Zn-dependent protease with chaperone function
MDFFAAQAAARERTRRLLIGYTFAVAAVVGAITWVVSFVYTLFATNIWSSVPYSERVATHPGLVATTALAVLGIIGIAALHRMAQLRGGGGAVATSLGGVKVTRETTDPRRRRLLNVVEEMAIASGLPVPEVYVLEQESALNAFAAGHAPADAAIAVTRGTLEQLNRAELQGVIGHEFSHILNGDMRLNTRLVGPLFGLLVIAIVARYALRIAARSGGRRGEVFFIPAALVVMALGYLGVLFGRLLQAAICRQREFLADASSVQFTRDTTGLRDALVRIARAPAGSTVATADGEDLAHLFIAAAFDRVFATHPPLAARVRALDPHYDTRVLEQLDTVARSDDVDVLCGETRAVLGLESRAGRVQIDHGTLSSQVGNAGLDAVAFAAGLRAALPADLHAALARGSTAACLWLAVALSADPQARTRQLALVRSAFGAAAAAAVAALAPRVKALPVVQYLPLLQRALPVLKSLPLERRRALIALTSQLATIDGRTGALEYLLGALATRYLADQVEPDGAPGRLALDACAAELGTLFAVVASTGHAEPADARRAYELGLASLLPRERPAYAAPAGTGWAGGLDRALERLARLAPAGKELLVGALARTITYDGSVRVEEAELLRAVCALLHCPLPPLLSPAGPDAGTARTQSVASN